MVTILLGEFKTFVKKQTTNRNILHVLLLVFPLPQLYLLVSELFVNFILVGTPEENLTKFTLFPQIYGYRLKSTFAYQPGSHCFRPSKTTGKVNIMNRVFRNHTHFLHTFREQVLGSCLVSILGLTIQKHLL